MSMMEDMLAVEGHLAAAEQNAKSMGPAESDAASTETASQVVPEAFHSGKKSSTWKKFKKMVKHPHTREIVFTDNTHAAATYHAGGPSSPSAASVTAASIADDAASEVMSEITHGTPRFAGRHDHSHSRAASIWDDSSNERSRGGTLRGMFELHGKKSKKVDPLQLDALRIEIGMLQERVADAERDLSSRKQEVEALTRERGALAGQVQELSASLNTACADLAASQAECERLKQLHSQVKGALQEAYTSQAAQKKQLRELEELCSAQQNSLEEGEERFRGLQQEQDQLHHAALAAKAQLVTAQAQLSEARAQREELLVELAGLTSQTAALQAELDSRDEKMSGLEEAAEQANTGLEQALQRLQELEGEQQQLEARVGLLNDENKQLAQELSSESAERRQLEAALAESKAGCSILQAQLDASNGNVELLTGRLRGLMSQLEGSSSLRSQNAELQRELANMREQQQQQQRRPSSPLSKWCRAQQKSAAAAAACTAAAAGTPDLTTGSSSNGSTAGCTSLSQTGAGTAETCGSSGPLACSKPQVAAAAAAAATGFSPMTSQLPTAVLQQRQLQHVVPAPSAPTAALLSPAVEAAAVIEDETHSCVMFNQAEVCCTVMATSSASDATAADNKAAGPLTASRPASSRRVIGPGKPLQQQLQHQEQQGSGVNSATSGEGAATALALPGAAALSGALSTGVAAGPTRAHNSKWVSSTNSSSGSSSGAHMETSHTSLLPRLFGCLMPQAVDVANN